MPFFFRSEGTQRQDHIQRLGEIKRPIHPTPVPSRPFGLHTHGQVDNGLRLEPVALQQTARVHAAFPSCETAHFVTEVKAPPPVTAVDSKVPSAETPHGEAVNSAKRENSDEPQTATDKKKRTRKKKLFKKYEIPIELFESVNLCVASDETECASEDGINEQLTTQVPVADPTRETTTLVTGSKAPSSSVVVGEETLGAVSPPEDNPVISNIKKESKGKQNATKNITQNKTEWCMHVPYKEGQWSPLNPEGKKQYDRDFLLQLQTNPLSLRKPSNLRRNLDIIKDKARIQRMPTILNHRRIYDQVADEHQQPQTAVGKRKKSKKSKLKMPVSENETIKLHESETPWVLSHKVGSACEEDAGEQELFKKIRVILNKITLQNFETFMEQMKELPIDSLRKLVGTVILIFERAILEPNFNAVYASMCKQLALMKVPLNVEQDCLDINFGEHLSIICQREFQQDKNIEKKCEETLKAIEAVIKDENKCKELQMEFDEDVKKIRMRKFGSIRFMGELFKLDMISEFTMLECIKNLLGQSHNDEESFDCLCQLLKDIGTELERKGKQDFVNLCIFWMQRIVDKHLTSLRARFMLQDVIDMMNNV